MYTNPLDSIRIASPCRSDWNEMYGDERKRFCSECKLNVYNLSGMSRNDAELLLMNSEGRLCVRFYRRSDGTVLTEDCPVGWGALKKRVSTTATAFASLAIGFIAGVLGIRATESAILTMPMGDVPTVHIEQPRDERLGGQMMEGVPEVGEVLPRGDFGYAVGRIEPLEKLREVRVKAWVR